MVLTILYIDNRYECQQEMIEIDRLKKELTDIKYDALTRSSELMEKVANRVLKNTSLQQAAIWKQQPTDPI